MAISEKSIPFTLPDHTHSKSDVTDFFHEHRAVNISVAAQNTVSVPASVQAHIENIYTQTSELYTTKVSKVNNIAPVNGNVTITDISGNAGTATKLKTARLIQLTGDVTGVAQFDGSANAVLQTNLANGGVFDKESYCANTATGILLTNSKEPFVPGVGTINLTRGYNTFKYLRVDFTGGEAHTIQSNIISVPLFTNLMTLTQSQRGLSNGSPYCCALYNLTQDSGLYWWIWTSNSAVDGYSASYKSTTTQFKYYSSNVHILGIWGFN